MSDFHRILKISFVMLTVSKTNEIERFKEGYESKLDKEQVQKWKKARVQKSTKQTAKT